MYYAYIVYYIKLRVFCVTYIHMYSQSCSNLCIISYLKIKWYICFGNIIIIAIIDTSRFRDDMLYIPGQVSLQHYRHTTMKNAIYVLSNLCLRAQNNCMSIKKKNDIHTTIYTNVDCTCENKIQQLYYVTYVFVNDDIVKNIVPSSQYAYWQNLLVL